jgi:hypothetical protein
MKGWLYVAVGVVLVAVGAIWGLQGAGTLGGSSMSGVTFWAVVGPIVAVVGLVSILLGARVLRRRDTTP